MTVFSKHGSFPEVLDDVGLDTDNVIVMRPEKPGQFVPGRVTEYRPGQVVRVLYPENKVSLWKLGCWIALGAFLLWLTWR
jgi:hypothetical protein